MLEVALVTVGITDVGWHETQAQSGKRELEYSIRCKSKGRGKTKASEMQGYSAASESKKNNELQIENKSLQTAPYRLYSA